MKIGGRSEVAEHRLRAALVRREQDRQPRSLLAPADGVADHPDSAAGAAGSTAPSLLPGLPSALRSGVLDAKHRGALALIALALVAALAAGALALRARPRASVVQRPLPAVVSGAASSAPAHLLVVDVAGEVAHPGLQRLPAGSRVADAVAAAGGAKRGASTSNLNLARKLIDGEQGVVGGVHPAGAAPTGAATREAGQPLDLNGASLSDLDQLSGVGPVLAQRIVTWRTEHGGFTTVDQLREVEGIGDRKFASLRAQVTV
jgi:competence protein ComEA